MPQTTLREVIGDSRNSPERVLPEEYHGWTLLENAEDRVTYWRDASTHVSGAFERLSLVEMKNPLGNRESEWKVVKSSFGKYGVQRSGGTTDRYPELGDETAFERALESAKRKMKRFPGDNGVVSPPSAPDTVGEWTLDEDTFKRWVWTSPKGETIEVERTDIQGRHSGFTKKYTATWFAPENYSGRGPQTVEFITDMLSTETLTTAIAAMESHPHGLTESGTASELLKLHGVGPVKARKFQLTGVASSTGLAKASVGRHDWCRARNTLFEKTMTKAIRNNLPENSGE